MFYALLSGNFLLIFFLYYLSKASCYGRFIGSMTNPLVVFCVFSIIFNVDFYMLWISGRTDIFEDPIIFSRDDILTAYSAYSILFLTAVMGMTIAQISWPTRSAELRAPRNLDGPQLHEAQRKSAILMYLILAVSIVALLISMAAMGAVIDGEETRQVFFRRNKIIQIAFSLVCPGLAIFLSVRRPSTTVSLVVIVASVGAISATGSRGLVILVLLIVAITLVTGGIRISTIWYVVVIPAVAFFLSVSRYFLRESWRYDSYAEFITDVGGYSELFFYSAEISLADAFATIIQQAETLPRAPFESLLGMIMYPLPRAIFEFKPWGASAYVTQELSPARWYWTKSEILTTGYGDLVLDFGLVGASVAAFFLAFVWLRSCLSAINGPSDRIVIWLSFLIWWMYVFVRGDIFNIGGTLWPFITVIFAYNIISRIRTTNIKPR